MKLQVPGNAPLEDEFVAALLRIGESPGFEVKRAGDNKRKIETVVAFANSEGGVLLIGVEDENKSQGGGRLFGIQENPESVDEFMRMLAQRITPPLSDPTTQFPRIWEIGCTLRDGKHGSILAVEVSKSTGVHSVVGGGTYVRHFSSNRQISAEEITALAMRRGSVSVVNLLTETPFELLDTSTWREYAANRRLTRPIGEAMRHLGLAREENGKLCATRAAVLLFAEEPSGLLDSKVAIRIFHYRGESVERAVNPNLVRPPVTVSGPLLTQIRLARDVVLNELASGVQVGALGFEIAQRYPVRVIQEAITNAVIHRDYHTNADIHVRIFSDRIEIESPGGLPGGVTTANVGVIGSRPRNRALVDHLREFPQPPNLDAGEGVPMMRRTMFQSDLYPPVFVNRDAGGVETVLVQLSNHARPSIWSQVEEYLERQPSIGNAEVRALLHTDNSVRASRLLKSWVELGLLELVNSEAPKQQRRYQRRGSSPATLFSGFAAKANSR
jgi:ATP-dependent DNA helicase RecG